jgi:hypothetical protein
MKNKKISITTGGSAINTIVSMDGVPIGQIQKIKFKTNTNGDFIMEITFPDWSQVSNTDGVLKRELLNVVSLLDLKRELLNVVSLLEKDYPFVKIKYSNKYFKSNE